MTRDRDPQRGPLNLGDEQAIEWLRHFQCWKYARTQEERDHYESVMMQRLREWNQ